MSRARKRRRFVAWSRYVARCMELSLADQNVPPGWVRSSSAYRATKSPESFIWEIW